MLRITVRRIDSVGDVLDAISKEGPTGPIE